jgi:hypothetical protein
MLRTLFPGCAVVLGVAAEANALFHLREVAVGICGPSAIAQDFPAVTLPAIIGAVLTLWAVSDARTAEHAHA